jgi:hypothetical protein
LNHAPKNPAVLSYYTMRRAVGIIALTLPFALAFGSILASLIGPNNALPQPLFERSISDYYYTPMRDYYVGALFAIGTFLACSRGYDRHDEITGYLAGAFAFVVALVPDVNPYHYSHNRYNDSLGRIHLVAASLMFLVLAYICLVLFRKSDPGRPLTRRKRDRNQVYLVCGLVIITCMSMMIPLAYRPLHTLLWPTGILFYCESVALVAFGVAWLVKGEVFLRDKPHNGVNQGRTNHEHLAHESALPGASKFHPLPEPARAAQSHPE